MSKTYAMITGVGGYVPTCILDNEEMSHLVDTSDEWIMERIGVKTRHVLKPQQGSGTSYLMERAVRQLLHKTGAAPESIDALICATTTPDYQFPSTASLVAGRLGLANAFGYDMEAACAGFLYALDAGAALIESGRCRRVIVCGGDHLTSVANYADRNTCPIFGDGAGCVMLEPTSERMGLIDSYLRVDGKGYDQLHLAVGGSAHRPTHEALDRGAHYLFQDGRVVFKHAVTRMSEAVDAITSRHGLNAGNVDWVVPHQANIRIEQAVARRIGVSEDKVMINIDHMANTSGGTIPLCLWEYEPQLRRGDKLVMTAFGAGFTWGANYLIWAYNGAEAAAKSPAEYYKEGETARSEWYKKRNWNDA